MLAAAIGLLFVAGCGGGGDGAKLTATESALVGHWAALSITDDTGTVPVSETGVDWDLVLSSDLTYESTVLSLQTGRTVLSGTWSAEGTQFTFTNNQESQTRQIQLNGNNLSMYFVENGYAYWVNFVRQ